jgi:hypothetical protein
MIAKAIFRDGGLFIPNVQAAVLHPDQEVHVRFELLEQPTNEDIFQKTSGLLKQRKIDPLKFQDDLRSVWDE